MKFLSLMTVTLCATVFCACASGPRKKVELMTGEQTAQKAGDSARSAEKAENTGILVDSSNDLVEKKVEPVEKTTASNGAKIYMDRCSVCHGNGRNGGVAPLTNLNSLEEIEAVTRDGRPALGMPGWRPYLSEKEIIAVSKFVFDFQATTP